MEDILYPEQPILLVDDEKEILEGSCFMFETHGINNIVTCHDSREVMSLIEKQKFLIVLLDLMMPHITGKELLEQIKQSQPELEVMVLTGLNDINTAVSCMKLGAFDYLMKPVEEQRLVTTVKRAIERQEEKTEFQTFKQLVLNDELRHPEAFVDIITNNKSIRSIFQYVEAISRSNKSVLITGASGVGKEAMAKAVHKLSRPDSPFVSVNIAGLDDNLFSDTLFGHVKGAFTGADSNRQGLIERAAGGTLFLDEIGDLNMASQIKLLRLLEDGEFFPVGSDMPKESTARIVTATNQDLQSLREKGEFRTDLYYRLQTHQIHLPNLNERFDDLPILVDHFLEEAAKTLGKKKPTPPKELMPLLTTYHFPGNIRELQSILFDAVSHHQSKVLSLDRIKDHIEKHRNPSDPKQTPVEKSPTRFDVFDQIPTLKEARMLLVGEAMERSKGNISIAAQMLGISRSGLSKLLKRTDSSDLEE
ncbi:MAG: sigma-54 dependent transcriptional regulator [Proteobacteria bacterium]|nr:sigma-54 dependent transcriptional regulator [Pseudomonadota bacterium]